MMHRTAVLCAAALILSLAAPPLYAQNEETPDTAPDAPYVPMWMPRSPSYPDTPMTNDEFWAISKARRITEAPRPPDGELPPAQRARLEEPVTVDLDGTVLEAAGALMLQSGREWLLSLNESSASRVAHLSASAVPLWQALDQLLDLYGYDWGYVHDTVVLWPAFSPPRARPEAPEGDAVPAASIPALPRPTLLETPTPVAEVIVQRVPEAEHVVPTLDPRLRDWKLVGRLAAGDTARLTRQVADALCAVVEGPADYPCLCMGAHMWLSRALEGVPALAARLTAQGLSLSLFHSNRPVQDALVPLFTDQQWELMDLGGRAIIWFRELPLEAAQMVVVATQAGDDQAVQFAPDPAEGRKMVTDWSHPECMYVCGARAATFARDPETRMWLKRGRTFSTDIAVLTVGGSHRGQN